MDMRQGDDGRPNKTQQTPDCSRDSFLSFSGAEGNKNGRRKGDATMKTLMLASMLALAAIAGAVVISDPAKADYGYRPGYGNFGYIYRYNPTYTVPLYRPRAYYRPRVYSHPVWRRHHYRHY